MSRGAVSAVLDASPNRQRQEETTSLLRPLIRPDRIGRCCAVAKKPGSGLHLLYLWIPPILIGVVRIRDRVERVA